MIHNYLKAFGPPEYVGGVVDGPGEDTSTDIDAVLGLGLFELTRESLRVRPKSAQITEAEIEDELARRKAARADKDFATSDEIRDELAAKGVEAMDGDPLGWEWKLAT